MKARIIRTAQAPNEKWKELPAVTLTSKFKRFANHVELFPEITHQTHLGFGGAITESAAYTLSEMPKEKREEVLKAYYSQEGLGYNLGRIHMNSCDFSLENYTYVKANDEALKTFDISREDKWVIPLIKDAEKYSGPLAVLVSPWSPPAWMKTNNNMNFGGELLPKYYDAWGRYYIKFLEELKKRKITVFGVSVQNEPAAKQTWDSCLYSPEQERDFVKTSLGPKLKAYDPNLKLLVWDHNRDIIMERVSPIYDDPQASSYVWGTATHWYVSEEFANLGKVHDKYPHKHLLFTEGCIEGGPKPGAWHTGERYARNIIGDFNNYCEGYIEWNIVLNEEGGPNHVKNFCDAPILADRPSKTLIYNSSYYYIGHFSKFIRPGAKRIEAKYALQPGVRAVSYKNTNGSLVVVLQNETNDAVDVSFNKGMDGFQVSSLAHSIMTFVIA